MSFWTNFWLATIASNMSNPGDRGNCRSHSYEPVKIVQCSDDEILEHEVDEVVEQMKRKDKAKIPVKDVDVELFPGCWLLRAGGGCPVKLDDAVAVKKYAEDVYLLFTDRDIYQKWRKMEWKANSKKGMEK